MAGLVPAIHAFVKQGVDARHKAGHDGRRSGEVVLFADTFNRYFESRRIWTPH